VRADAARLEIELTNPGAFRGRRDGGSGLPMIENRLRLTYGARGEFAIAAATDANGAPCTRATLRVPRSEAG
jgi:hypothetical protein